MRFIILIILLVLHTTGAFALEDRRGYVHKVGEGKIAAGALIKVSPQSGTQSGVVMLQPVPEDFSTGLHIISTYFTRAALQRTNR